MAWSIRGKRRNRYLKKILLNRLDRYVLARIDKSYMWSSCSWGGSRCPGCGKKIRPHLLMNYSNCYWTKGDDGKIHPAWLTAYGYACDSIFFKGKCPGINENWEDKYYSVEIEENEL
jgi:hypothetical protein